MSVLDLMTQWSTIITIWGGLFAQTGFIILFSFREWQKWRITRAFYWKSWAMEGILARSAMLLTVRGFRPNVDDPVWVSVTAIGLNFYVLWAIWYQFIAMIIEIVEGKPIIGHEEGDHASRR